MYLSQERKLKNISAAFGLIPTLLLAFLFILTGEREDFIYCILIVCACFGTAITITIYEPIRHSFFFHCPYGYLRWVFVFGIYIASVVITAMLMIWQTLLLTTIGNFLTLVFMMFGVTASNMILNFFALAALRNKKLEQLQLT